MKYWIGIAAVIAGFLCAGCTSRILLPKESPVPTDVENDGWVSLAEHSPDVAQKIDQITSVGVKSVNYMVENSISSDIDDPEVIAALIDAIKEIEVGASTNMRKTDSGRRITFYLKDGAKTYIGFSSDDYIEDGEEAYIIRGFGALKAIERDLN